MSARDEAIEAAYQAVNSGTLGVQMYRRDIEQVLAAAVPVLLADVASRIAEDIDLSARSEAEVATNGALHDACRKVRAAAEGWVPVDGRRWLP